MEEELLIKQGYWTINNLRDISLINKIANFVKNLDNDFLPTELYGGKVTNNRNVKFNNQKDLDKFIDCFLNTEVIYIVLTNSSRSKKDAIVGLTFSIMKNLSVVNFNLSKNYFSNESKIKKFLKTGIDLAKLIEPIFGVTHDMSNFNKTSKKPINILESLPGAYWGNYFGQYYIEKIGRDKLLSFNSYKTEILDNNDILIFTSKDPLNPEFKDAIKARKALYKLVSFC